MCVMVAGMSSCSVCDGGRDGELQYVWGKVLQCVMVSCSVWVVLGKWGGGGCGV